MDFERKWAELQHEHGYAKFQFVVLELELAITYCFIAAAATDPAKISRNIANAERAYSTAAYFLDNKLNPDQSLEIREKLDLFRSLRMNCDGNAEIQ